MTLKTRKSLILGELPNMTQTLNVKNVLGKRLQGDYSTQDCYKSFICTTNQRKANIYDAQDDEVY